MGKMGTDWVYIALGIGVLYVILKSEKTISSTFSAITAPIVKTTSIWDNLLSIPYSISGKVAGWFK